MANIDPTSGQTIGYKATKGTTAEPYQVPMVWQPSTLQYVTLQADATGALLTSGGGGGGTAAPASTVTSLQGTVPWTVTNIGIQAVNIVGGSISGGNAAAGLTGSPVPTSADFLGFQSGSTLIGVSSSSPLPITGTISAAGTVGIAGTVSAAGGIGINGIVSVSQSGIWTVTQSGLVGVNVNGTVSNAGLQSVTNIGIQTVTNIGVQAVNIVGGSISGGNAAASLTGTTIPTSADYLGFASGGNLVGVSSSQPLPVSVISGGGGGTQYADGTTQATPTGTVALGKNPSNILKSVSLDASGNLNVNLAAGSIQGGNAAAGLTGSPVPTSADFTGFQSGANLVGVSSSSPLPITGTVSAAGTVGISGTVSAAGNVGVSVVNTVNVSQSGVFNVSQNSVWLVSQNATVPISQANTFLVSQVAIAPVSQANLWQVSANIPGTVAISQANVLQVSQVNLWQVSTGIITVTATAAAALNVTGTITVTNTAAAALQVTGAIAGPTLTKGTQGSTGFSVQPLRDAGRTAIQFFGNSVASSSGEIGVNLTQAKGTASNATVSSYVVTNAKTLRLTNFTVASRGNTGTATTQSSVFSLRVASAVVTSQAATILLQAATHTTGINQVDRVSLPLPDGIEISGNGTVQIGLTAKSVFVSPNAPTWDVFISGFEY